ncbi:MAG: hypothetical protein VKI81_11335, partial [Synechococcaceae cyanobacterium]|nr:hypothetical protein [Synechococcaceae cyanobacterium]
GFLEGLADTASVEVVDAVASLNGLPPAVVELSGEAIGGEYDIDDPDFELVDEVLPLGVEAPPVLPPQDQLIQDVVIGPPEADTVFRSTFGIRVSAVGAFADHRLDLGLGLEKTTGPLFGAEFAILLSRRLEFTFRGMAGTLTASDALVEDRNVLSVEGTARYAALDFFDIEIGAGLRNFDTQLASQTWGWASAGIGLRGEALEGALRGRVGFSLLPIINVTGQTSPDFGLIGSAELEYRFSHFWVGVHYALSRYEFPDVAGVARVEQFSEIRLTLGWFIGKF